MDISITVFLLASLVCASAGEKWEKGFSAGAETELQLELGAAGTIAKGGEAVNTEGLLGAQWKGKVFGGKYSGVDNKYTAIRGIASGQLAGTVRPFLSAKFGENGVHDVNRNFDVHRDASFQSNIEFMKGNEDKILAAIYGHRG